MNVPPPKDWQAFERYLRDLLEAHWGVPTTMHGRTGQPQHGVDIYGQPNGEAYHGVRCKRAARFVSARKMPAAAISSEMANPLSWRELVRQP